MNCELMGCLEPPGEPATVCETCFQRMRAERDEAREQASLFLAQLHVRGITGIGWKKFDWLAANTPPDESARLDP